MLSFKIKPIIKLSIILFFFTFIFSINAAQKVNNSLESYSDSDIYQNHAFNNSSAVDHGAIEEIDTFKGYLKLSRTDIHLPGAN